MKISVQCLLLIYAIGFFITLYVMFLIARREEKSGKNPSDTEEATFHVALFWPLLVALLIVVAPVYLLKKLAEKHSDSI